MKKIVNIILIVYIIVLLTFYLVGHFEFTNFKALRVISGSMFDTIRTGETIIIKRSDEYKVGDIITYKVNNNYITHRIISMNNDEVTTKGDANNTIDDPISISLIEGKVILVIPEYYIFIYKIFGIVLFVIVCIFDFGGKKDE